MDVVLRDSMTICCLPQMSAAIVGITLSDSDELFDIHKNKMSSPCMGIAILDITLRESMTIESEKYLLS